MNEVAKKHRISLIVLIFGLAFSIALLIYAMDSLRSTLDHSKSSDVFRAIGHAILLYSNDARGIYPTDWGALAVSEDITPILFISPASSTTVPEKWNSLAAEASWINAHADYVYLGAHFRFDSKSDPQIVLAYEKPRGHGGMNVLFLDGSTLYYGPAATATIIQQLQAGTNPPLWSSIPDKGRHLGFK